MKHSFFVSCHETSPADELREKIRAEKSERGSEDDETVTDFPIRVLSIEPSTFLKGGLRQVRTLLCSMADELNPRQN
jgi:hypothetical protein